MLGIVVGVELIDEALVRPTFVGLALPGGCCEPLLPGFSYAFNGVVCNQAAFAGLYVPPDIYLVGD